MGLVDTIKEYFKPAASNKPVRTESQFSLVNEIDTTHNEIIFTTYDGEKTPGELGSIEDSLPDHLKLRLRAYNMDLKTDLVKIITGKFFKWVVGNGLKFQAEPNKEVLEMLGYSEDIPGFKKKAEALFGLYSNSKYADFKREGSLHTCGQDAFKTAFLGGDCLCVIRIEEHGPSIQVIDGQQVENPFIEEGIHEQETFSEDAKKGKNVKAEGNKIIKGIEIDGNGRHVAYWVRKIKMNDNALIEHERVEVYNSLGHRMAWMMYGDKARIDHHRGIPRIAAILEKISKLDRFTEASVSKAEQTANVVYAFEHDENSTGDNIMAASLSSKKNTGEDILSAFEKNGRTAASLRQSTSGTVLNLIPGSKLASLYNESETAFEPFFRAIFCHLCASVDIPEEVALQKYEQNYSSSRAAINGWEHIVEIFRKAFSDNFYQRFYSVWLEYQVLKGTLKLNGLMRARKEENVMALEAYFSARFTGKKMPHIDPAKEAKAIRTLLGESNAALISHEQATEMMGAGDWQANFEKYLEEDKIIPEPEIPEENVNASIKKPRPAKKLAD